MLLRRPRLGASAAAALSPRRRGGHRLFRCRAAGADRAGADPQAITFIDLQGPSLRIVDLQHMRGPAEAQLVAAPKPLTVPASLIGQVFGVALDDAMPPNIYAAATSAYGLPIVAPGPDGKPRHIEKGVPQASFMPGLWGPRGGPGSIWRFDGVTGAVTLFATITTNGRANSGAALGGIAFDPESKSLFVVDRESGLIHRLSPTGAELGSYDHGITGRAAQGLPEVAWTPPPPLDVAAPSFDSTAPASWNYAAPARRVFGLAVHEGRLYYAVADGLQVWSVGLGPDGAFGSDAVIELGAPPSSGPTEISKITFDEQNRMYLADRPAPTGAFDFEALSVPAIGRVLRYAVRGMANGQRVWQVEPDDYAIGFPPAFRNGNGGVAIGYDYDRDGEMFFGSCGGFLWSTGEDLRDIPRAGAGGAARPRRTARCQRPAGQRHLAHAARQRAAARQLFHRLRRPVRRSRRARPSRRRRHRAAVLGGAARRAVAAAAARRPAAGQGRAAGRRHPAAAAVDKYATRLRARPGTACRHRQLRSLRAAQCRDQRRLLQRGADFRDRRMLQWRLRGRADADPAQALLLQFGPGLFRRRRCARLLQRRAGQRPVPAAGGAADHHLRQGLCAGGRLLLPRQQGDLDQHLLPGGAGPGRPEQQPVRDHRADPDPHRAMLPLRQIPTANGQCCAAANVTASGTCCAGKVDPNNRNECIKLIPLAQCAAGYSQMPDGSCCLNRYVGSDGKSCQTERRPCGPGEVRDANGNCAPQPTDARRAKCATAARCR